MKKKKKRKILIVGYNLISLLIHLFTDKFGYFDDLKDL